MPLKASSVCRIIKLNLLTASIMQTIHPVTAYFFFSLVKNESKSLFDNIFFMGFNYHKFNGENLIMFCAHWR